MATGCSNCGTADKKMRRGWCFPCYMRWRRAGRPESGPPPSSRRWHIENAAMAQELAGVVAPELFDLAVRFWSKVRRGAPGECWPWTHATNEHGYGVMRPTGARSGPTLRAHRVALVLNGRDPGDLIVRHRCDNPPCCNPAHLLVGTMAQNSADMVERGRSARGERSGMAKLTDADVLEVRSLSAAGWKRKDVAARFGVSSPTITRIVKGEGWRHLSEDAAALMEVISGERLERAL